MGIETIKSATRWRHKEDGVEYNVVLVANEHSDNEKDWPTTVVFTSDDGKCWSRPIYGWLDEYESVPNVKASYAKD